MEEKKINTTFHNILIFMLFVAYCTCFYVDFRESKKWGEKYAFLQRKLESAETDVNTLKNKLEILEEDLAISRTKIKIVRLPRLLLNNKNIGFPFILDRSYPLETHYYNIYASGDKYELILTLPVANIRSFEIRYNKEKMIDGHGQEQAKKVSFSREEKELAYDFRSFHYKGKATYIDCPNLGIPGYYYIAIKYSLPDKTQRTDYYYIEIRSGHSV